MLISSVQSSVLCHLQLHLLIFPFSFKRDDPQDVPNPKTEEEDVTKQTSSNQVPLSGTVGPTEESGRKGEVFHSSLKPTRQETTMQSNIDPLDTKKSKSTEKRKTSRYVWKTNLIYSVSAADCGK